MKPSQFAKGFQARPDTTSSEKRTALDRLNGRNDVLATLLHVVLGHDRHGLHLLLGTNDMFKGRTEFRGQAPVGHQHHTDHFKRPFMERSA
jgi:hypothetical protein